MSKTILILIYNKFESKRGKELRKRFMHESALSSIYKEKEIENTHNDASATISILSEDISKTKKSQECQTPEGIKQRKGRKDKTVVAVIPAYSEETSIGTIILLTKQYVDHILVIDDGSNDRTKQIAKLAGAEVIRHPINIGKGAALKSAFERAEELGFDILVTIDGDGQHDPDEIPILLSPILDGEADVVIGSRFIDKKGKKEISLYRRFGNFILTKATNFGSKDKVSDSQSGFRVFSKKCFGKFSFSEVRFGIESEMIREGIDNDLRIKDIPMSCKYNNLHKFTQKPGKQGMSVLASILENVKDKHPLLYFGITGVVFLLVGMVIGLYTSLEYINHNQILIVPALISILFLLVGLLAIFSGLTLNSLGNILERINGRSGEGV